jgi:DNA-binding response OmpR family regulator
MLTGRADVASVLAAKKAGVSAYSVKPISAEALRTKIRALTSSASSAA